MQKILWNFQNATHIAENGLTIEDVAAVLSDPIGRSTSRSSGRPCVFGYSEDGDFCIVVYENFPEGIYPVTAYRVEEQ